MTNKTYRFAAVAAVLLALLVFAAPVGAEETTVSTSEAFNTAVTNDVEHIIINLEDDVSYDVTAWSANPLGGTSTKTITINGNYHTLTFNQLNSDWNNIHTNGAKLILNNIKITSSGHNDGPWNRHDLNFNCSVEMTNVYSDKALAFKNSAKLTNVTITDSGVYAIWIMANGQTVTLDDCDITMESEGRGIKISDQYCGPSINDHSEEAFGEDAQKITLSVSDSSFTTQKKAAILVSSIAGADITLNNVDISSVDSDTVNAVWLDEEWYESSKNYLNLITVTGGSVVVEGSVAKIGETYYATLAEAVDAATAATAVQTVTLLKDVTLTEIILIENGDDLTINGNGKKITGPTASVVAIQVDGGKLTLGEGLTVFSESGCPLYIRYGDVITSANLITNGVYGAIQGNGNDKGNVTINGGTLTSAGSAIYWPQDGALIINGGTITGKNAVYFKSGSLSITDGTFVGNGVKTEYSYDGSGNVDTGDALAIENVGNTGYEAISSVSVSGGTFTSVNASAVASYAATSENPDAKPVTAFITGGTFSSNPSAYIASGMEVVQPGDKYLVQKYVDRSSSSSSSSTTEPEEPEQPEEPVVEPETPAAPGEVTVETEVTDGGEVELETPAAEGEGGSAAADEDEAKITGVVLPTGTDSEVTFVPVSEQPAPAGQEENTKKVFEINVPKYEKGKPATVKFTMTVAELEKDGKTAADVALWLHDEETGEWTKLVTTFVIKDGIVYFEAITFDFSPFAIVYEDTELPTDEPETPEQPTESPAPILAVLAGLGAAVVLRRK